MQRNTETAEERAKRTKQDAERKTIKNAEADDAIDEMIKRNIDLYGP